jgi:hypothetical protein
MSRSLVRLPIAQSVRSEHKPCRNTNFGKMVPAVSKNIRWDRLDFRISFEMMPRSSVSMDRPEEVSRGEVGDLLADDRPFVG